MLSNDRLWGITALALCVATPAMALNPQPLPPGRYLANRTLMLHSERARHVESVRIGTRYRPILLCHAVQVGDPRKQPPMRVCP